MISNGGAPVSACDDEFDILSQSFRMLPFWKGFPLIQTNQKIKSGIRRKSELQLTNRLPGEGGGRALELEWINVKFRMSGSGQFEHLQSVLVGGARVSGLVRRAAAGKEYQLIELKRSRCFRANFQVPFMDWVKRASKKSDTQWAEHGLWQFLADDVPLDFNFAQDFALTGSELIHLH